MTSDLDRPAATCLFGERHVGRFGLGEEHVAERGLVLELRDAAPVSSLGTPLEEQAGGEHLPPPLPRPMDQGQRLNPKHDEVVQLREHLREVLHLTGSGLVEAAERVEQVPHVVGVRAVQDHHFVVLVLLKEFFAEVMFQLPERLEDVAAHHQRAGEGVETFERLVGRLRRVGAKCHNAAVSPLSNRRFEITGNIFEFGHVPSLGFGKPTLSAPTEEKYNKRIPLFGILLGRWKILKKTTHDLSKAHRLVSILCGSQKNHEL